MSGSNIFETCFELHPDALVISDGGTIRAVNVQTEKLLGISRRELIGCPLEQFLPGGDGLSVALRKDGTTFVADIVTRKIADSTLLTSFRSIAPNEVSEELLRDSNRFNREIVDSIQMGLIVLDRNLRYLLWNPKMEEISGVKAESVLGKHPLEVFPFLKDAGTDILLNRALAGETLTSPDFPFDVPASGKKGWSSQTVSPLRNSKGEITGVIASVSDITERKKTEDALRESEERFRGLVDTSPLPMLVAARRGERIELLNKSFIDTFGYTLSEVYNLRTWETHAYPNERYREAIHAGWKEANETAETAGRKTVGPVEAVVACRDGSLRFVEVFLCRYGDRSLVIFSDLTERKQAENALRGSEARFRTIVEALPVMMGAIGEDGLFVAWNGESERITGYRADEMVGNPKAFEILFPDPEYRAIVFAAQESDTAPPEPWRVTCKDGSTRIVRWYRVSSQLPIPGWARWGVGIDITAQHRLEEQLRQSQKMQAIGQLAGGVAHDFNNLLTVINGYGDVLMRRFAPDDPSQEMLGEIRGAGERAARLVKQLLLFSRKAMVAPRILNLKDLLPPTTKMLRRLIGEDIKLTAKFAPDLYDIRVDPGQIEQVVMNLCLNARDTMPAGGSMIVEAQNATLDGDYCRTHPCFDVVNFQPGKFVCLSVSDTGTGMTPEVKARMFEPFFTTKQSGEGTGLGLATVYAIVQQSGGFIAVESEVNKGTKICVCLPAITEPRIEPVAADAGVVLPKGGETVLVVEDNQQVREITSVFLESFGYRVLQAANGPEGLRVAAEFAEPIHLLLSDVVMPEMSGSELAQKMVEVRPEIKVLFMSGHNEDAMISRGLVAGSFNLLAKPFTDQELAKKVREALG